MSRTHSELNQRLRNIGIMAHIDAGKTTVTERVLYYTGLLHRMGEVHDGDTTTDFDPEERRRGITISAATVTTSWAPTAGAQAGVRHTLRIIDTPGHIDFAVEVERSLRVLDGAIFVLDASKGVECQSEAVWRQADRYGVPRITFVNKMDKVGADFGRCLADLRERLGASPVAVHLPLGAEAAFRGVVDLVRMQALDFAGVRAGNAPAIVAIPAALHAAADEARARLIEACADVDDGVLEAWAAGISPSPDALERALRAGVLAGRLHVVLAGSALANVGMQPLLDAAVAYLPSPAERPPAVGAHPRTGEAVRCAPDANEPLAALAFKTVSDPCGTLTFVRVYAGCLRRGDTVLVPARAGGGGRRERVGRLFVVHASTREEVDRAVAGDIVGALGLGRVRTGETLCAEARPVVLESIAVPEPVLEVAIEPATTADSQRLGPALAAMCADDPSLRVRVDEESGQTVLGAMGELHVEIAEVRLARDHGVSVRRGRPRVAYRDTLGGRARVAHRHIKQDGGQGQFACVTLEVEPAERGTGLAFVDDTVGGVVPAAFVPAVEKGVRAAAARGIRGGYPLVDVVVRLVDGDWHRQDSSTLAFELAAAAALRAAARAAGLTLLEPVTAVEVTAPEASTGAVVGDLVMRRGIVRDLAARAGASVIAARVPLAALFGYVPALRSLTHGRGTAAITPAGYEPVPDRLAAELVAAAA